MRPARHRVRDGVEARRAGRRHRRRARRLRDAVASRSSRSAASRRRTRPMSCVRARPASPSSAACSMRRTRAPRPPRSAPPSARPRGRDDAHHRQRQAARHRGRDAASGVPARARHQPAPRRRRDQRRGRPEGPVRRRTRPRRRCAGGRAHGRRRRADERRRRHRRRHRGLRVRVRAGEGRRDASRCWSTARRACRRPTPPPACSRRSSSRPRRGRCSQFGLRALREYPALVAELEQQCGFDVESAPARHPQGRVHGRRRRRCAAPPLHVAARARLRHRLARWGNLPRAGAAAQPARRGRRLLVI